MSRTPQGPGKRGSLKWIQEFVNGRREKLDEAIMSASSGKIEAPIDWVSPLEDDDFAEYRDRAFLERLGVSLAERPLDSFWPRRGPQWDALGTDSTGAVILVEAKAHIPEIISGPTGAGPTSKQQIDTALTEVAEFLGANSTCEWSGTFYQYANRLAHLYLLHELNDLDAWLVFVCFVGDIEMNGPRTAEEWTAALEVLRGALAVRGRHALEHRVVDVFVDVSTSRPESGE